MFEELLPNSLSSSAKALGVEPLEVIRLMVESDTVTPHLTASSAQLASLAEVGGIESGWWTDRSLPSDSIQTRGLVRGMLQLLIEKGTDGRVRMDNLWRGLELDDQGLIDEALNILAEEEVLKIVNAPSGVQVLLDDTSRTRVMAIADARESIPALDELYQG